MASNVRADGDREEPLSLDRILELLSNSVRREIVRFLRDSEGNVHDLDDLITHLLEREREQPGPAPGRDHLLSVLAHVHGPKLAEAGLCEYDLRSRQIRYYPDERVETVLDAVEGVAEQL